MSRTNLDEMQVQKRNMVGNQAFMLLFYLLLIDIGLSGFGFRWLQYPMNVFVIMLGCMTYYLTRIIWNNSYVGPRPKNRNENIGRRIALGIGGAAFVAGTVAYLNMDSLKKPISTGDNSAMILFVFSIVLFIVLGIVSLLTKWQARNDE
ncbi:DUF6773 family protein [Desulfosporosinus lacus]|uniref:Uncharacterized protein n=1 Tax=Desulfosporosinus lacus DSM 15449 TaxID=1121420 RepID=A0A1M6BW29_9FIRM|nr:DUF6773 family protein [Desulfosporosinus lacus]SHI52996.1 hypothetical protein SAMN02746098_04253 [Desulfosporosinus lacus DSM 15449]